MSKKKTIEKPSFANRYGHLLPYALLVFFVFLIYGNALENAFHFDDEISIHNNADIKSFKHFTEITTWTTLQERPFSYFTLAINYALGGLNPKGYHWFNMLFHLLASILVYLLSRSILKLGFPELQVRKTMVLSLGIALIFAAHTIQVMAVAYVVQRMTILAALFYFWSVWLYIQARQNHILKGLETKTLILYVFTGLTAILALLSKQNAATLPLMCLVVEIYFIRGADQKIAKKYLIAFGGILITGFLYVLIFDKLPRETLEISRGDYLVSQFKVLILYVQLLVFPRGFNIDHNIAVSQSLFGVYELLGLALLSTMVFFTIRWYKKHRLLSFGLLWFMLSLSLESSIIPITDLMMEHRIYLPLFGFAILLNLSIFLLFKKHMIRYSLVIILLALILGATTYNRNSDWKTNKSIWMSSLEETPDNKRALVYVGRAIAIQDPNTALRYFNRSITVDSNYYHGWFNRGIIYFDKHNYKEAFYSFDRAISIDGLHHDKIYYFMGACQLYLRDYPLSLTYFDEYIKRNDKDAKAYMFRGEVHFYLKNTSKTAADFIKALQLDPNQVNLYLNLIDIYYQEGDMERVIYFVNLAKQRGLTVPETYLQPTD